MDTWADERPLYIWSGDTAADLAPVKAAKVALGIQEKVIPFGLDKFGRKPDGTSISLHARVLAIGFRPPFICEHALVRETTTAEGFQRALSWVLGLTEVDPKANTVVDAMVAIFGPGTREVTREELESERKMVAYLSGRG